MTKDSHMIHVSNLSKKFCSDIHFNMYYGMKEVFLPWTHKANYHTLRKKEFWALENISFKTNSGDILAVIGTNGSGKTTLMRMIAGIYQTNSGRIEVDATHRITPIFALKSGMSPVFTGRENIYIKGAMLGMSKKEIDDKLDEIVGFAELEAFVDMPYGNYSSGMRSRLAYAIALATDPNIFIIDEALAVGDDAFKQKCFDNLKEFVTQPDKCVLFVSNNIEKVARVANRVIVLDKGKLLIDTYDVNEGFDFYLKNSNRFLDDHQKQLNKLKRLNS